VPIDSFAQLLGQADELIIEMQQLQREQISDSLIATGKRIHTVLLLAHAQLGTSRMHLEDAERLRTEIIVVCQRLGRVIDEARPVKARSSTG
jgi:hypothetical protein